MKLSSIPLSTMIAWAMQADLSTLKGGQDWDNKRWDTETLAFYNRQSLFDYVRSQP